jgi:putative peptide zinc metalloprotease protein
MSGSTLSQHWYRIAPLKPELREHVELHRHYYRGTRTYMLQDMSTGAFHRFSPEVYDVIGQMDGRRTLDEIWQTSVEQLGDDAPTQDDVISLFGQLHGADLLRCDVTPDSLEVFRRFSRQRRQDWKKRVLNPMSIRLPLLDPEKFLERFEFLVRPLFSWAGFLVWLVTIALAVVLAGMHWGAITENVIDRVLNPWNLVIMFFIYPVVKVLHELGHAFATRVRGGEVHELGIIFLVLMPVPYVDATSSAGFRNKYHRILVGAAGMMVELFLAAIALFVWLNAETGIVSAIAYNVMLIGSVSTLFFNGNPLLRFDGYYILADAVEIPNLGVRSTRYLNYLAMRYLYGMENVSSPVSARGEAAWFAFYGIAAFVYRLIIMFAIALFVAGKFFIVGVLLAIWALVMQLVMPLWKHIAFLLRDARLNDLRVRALSINAFGISAVAGLLLFMPAPLWTMAEGVVWLPEQSRIRAGADCFITGVLVANDSAVTEGEAVLACEAPLLTAEVGVQEARLNELRARYQLERTRDRVEAESIRQDMAAVEHEVEVARQQMQALIMRSPATGTTIIPDADDLPGRFVKRGETIAYVTADAAVRARVVVPQDDFGLVRRNTERVELRPASAVGKVYPAMISREVPAASDNLPSKALGTGGGGNFPVDPADKSGVRTLDTVFQVELELADDFPANYYGQRVYVRFEHGTEPLAMQWTRSLKQLFMRNFGV